MILIKSTFDIEQIKKACLIWKKVRIAMYENVAPNISLQKLDAIAKKIILENNAKPTFYKYNGYKANICTSVNEVVIHGVPNDYKLKYGDLISIDVGVTYNGYVCDGAYTIIVGENKIAEKISKACLNALMKGIEMAQPNKTVGDISNSIGKSILESRYKILKNFTGHGCGKNLHEDPIVPNYGEPNQGAKLIPGMILCLEPMILTDNEDYFISKKDQWSVIAKNKQLTAHWEHMILITKNGNEILTE